MEIKTKYEYDQEIHFISNDHACKSIIRGIKIECWSHIEGWQITYLCHDEPESRVHIKVDEKKAFPTKQELLNSL